MKILASHGNRLYLRNINGIHKYITRTNQPIDMRKTVHITVHMETKRILLVWIFTNKALTYNCTSLKILGGPSYTNNYLRKYIVFY
jgi:hypothetical protein